ncbi:MAG: hypothetical protein AB8H79_19110 [Myxococcota bacterium]
MKVAAHPMLVAVALGLLSPSALAADPSESKRSGADKRQERRVASHSTHESSSLSSTLERTDVEDALEDEDAPYWTQLTLVDGDDDAAAWRKSS